ncbi:stimulated by retinoic acid gene 8 protein-like [Octopus sinensis]|uniref:Stimulated by retinoic acid gene 8 protein-like n=1 Tax=Octopus sinensis TaxID=2607531 RepID=A0A6P7SK94_9MOLL|nr:stimulated by retinoic acid gene 8 protein-like [Octopus sinensis]
MQEEENKNYGDEEGEVEEEEDGEEEEAAEEEHEEKEEVEEEEDENEEEQYDAKLVRFYAMTAKTSVFQDDVSYDARSVLVLRYSDILTRKMVDLHRSTMKIACFRINKQAVIKIVIWMALPLNIAVCSVAAIPEDAATRIIFFCPTLARSRLTNSDFPVLPGASKKIPSVSF